MKSARPTNDETGAPGMGASIVSLGTFPEKRATVTAEVLARLLSGERMTSLDAVFGASTTRLAAVIKYLETDYAWNIDRVERAAGCRDGRLARVSEYFLRAEVVRHAMTVGGRAWSAEVRAARTSLRAKAVLAQIAAQKANRAGGVHSSLGQWSLFEGEGVST